MMGRRYRAFVPLLVTLLAAAASHGTIQSIADQGSHAAAYTAMALHAAMAAVPDYAGDEFDLTPDTGGTPKISFSANHQALDVGSFWLAWSETTPRVYFTGLSVTSSVYTLPTGFSAIDFYLQPESFGLWLVTATAGSTVLQQSVPSSPTVGAGGAKYFGFYSDDGSDISSVQVDAESGANGWAIGEFRLGTVTSPVPEPGTLALLGCGLMAIRRRRRRA